MSGLSGSDITCALKLATVWGQPALLGPADGFLSLPTSIKETMDGDDDDSLGLYYSGDGTPGAVKCDGDLPLYLRYSGIERLLALGVGGCATPVLHSGGAVAMDYAYTHQMTVDGLFATFIKHMQNYIAEVPGLKITGFIIKGEAGKPLELVLNTTGCFINKNTSAGTNTLTTANNITIAETGNRVQFSQCIFRMNDQSGAALGSGDVITPSSFELSFQRKLTGVYGSMSTGTGAMREAIDEPTNDGMPEISLKLGFPRHTSATMLSALGNDTRKKLDITATGSIIEGAIPHLFMLRFPHLQIKNVDVVDEQGIIKEPVEFICHVPSVPPAGMDDITTPFVISGTNTSASNPLSPLNVVSSYPLPGASNVPGVVDQLFDPPISITFDTLPTADLFNVDDFLISKQFYNGMGWTSDQQTGLPGISGDGRTLLFNTAYKPSYSAQFPTTIGLSVKKSIGLTACPLGWSDTGLAYKFTFTTAL